MSDITQPEAAQPQPAEPTAPAQASWEPDPNAEPPKPNLLVGLIAGLIIGLLAAVLYTVVTVVSEREFLFLSVLMGIAVAFGFYAFGHTKGIVSGLIAAIVSAAVYVVGIFLTTAGLAAKVYDMAFTEALKILIEHPVETLELYFEEDALSWVFFGLSVVVSFFYAFRGAKQSEDEDEDEVEAAPTQA